MERLTKRGRMADHASIWAAAVVAATVVAVHGCDGETEESTPIWPTTTGAAGSAGHVPTGGSGGQTSVGGQTSSGGGSGAVGGHGTGGGTTGCSSPNECPAGDDPCFTPTCEQHECGFEPSPAGTDCSSTGGIACDGWGTCLWCGDEPAPAGTNCPPQCTLGCTNGRCLIGCPTSGSCAGGTITCPAGFACRVQCTGSSSCAGSTIECPEGYACSVSCGANGACSDTTVQCGTGTCMLGCDAGGACDATSTHLICGPQACTASCSSGTKADVQCGAACDCQATGC